MSDEITNDEVVDDIESHEPATPDGNATPDDNATSDDNAPPSE